VDLRAVSVGTEVNIEQRGVPDVIPAEACYLGWQDSLHKLTKLICGVLIDLRPGRFETDGENRPEINRLPETAVKSAVSDFEQDRALPVEIVHAV